MTTSPQPVLQSHQSLVGRFEAVAGTFQDSVAIHQGAESCTYGELELRSRCLAHRILDEMGEEPRPVALLIRNKLQAISAILAVVRAGHFYCALSHRDPVTRLQRMLQDLGPGLLIVDESLRPLAEEISHEGCRLMVAESPAGRDVPGLRVQVGPESLLGVFYTSGSTGVPKGVMRRHEHVMHRLSVDVDDFGIGPGDRMLFLKRLDVTSSLWQLFGGLLTGATLSVCEAEEMGLAPLAERMHSERITLFAPPIELLRAFLDSLKDEDLFDSIRGVVLGGDVLFKRDVERLRRHIPAHAFIIHHLSSSESGLLARTVLNHDSCIEGTIVPVGYPVTGKSILLLDENNMPVGGGHSGQIVVRTRLRFAGYWRRPAESASKFSPDPDLPGEEVFLTGDLGRFTREGQLLFLGRSDFRVKIRGFSVDCASIEGALHALPNVRRAVVIPVDKDTEQKRLVAYVVPNAGATFEAAEARLGLSESLPDHALPQQIILLSAFPMTASGKIDRSALSQMANGKVEPRTTSGEPGNALEWELVRIWEALLNVKPVGVQDDFFELGGHSLLAMRMLDKIEQTIGVRCPVTVLLASPTIKGLAQAILEGQLSHLGGPLIHLRSGGRRPPFYFFHGDYSGGGLYCRTIAKHLDQERPFIVIPSHGLADEPPPTIEQMAAERLQAILAQHDKGPFLLGGYCHGGLIAFEMARQLVERGLKVDLILLVDAVGERPQHRLTQGLFRLYGAMHGLSRTECHALGIRALVERVQLEREGRWASLGGTFDVIGNVGALIRRLYRLNRILRHLRKEGLRLPALADTASRTSPDYREGYLRSIYNRAVRSYVARAYPGKVIVLRTSATDARFPGDPTLGWGQVAEAVETSLIPGDHLTCLTEHVTVLAETLNAYLRDLDARNTPGRVPLDA